jgi:hypothetical protein
MDKKQREALLKKALITTKSQGHKEKIKLIFRKYHVFHY